MKFNRRPVREVGMNRALFRTAGFVIAASLVGGFTARIARTTETTARNGAIVYASVDFAGRGGLFVINPAGGNPRRLIAGFDAYPVWSPDGKEIAFSQERTTKRHELDVIKADGSGRRTVIRTGVESVAGGLVPAWSPDGRMIAFCSERSGTLAIYTIRTDGHGLHQLTHDQGGSCEPDWSPDGKSIVFGTVRNGASQQIYVMRSDGTKQHALTRNRSKDDGAPHWSPDGSKIVFSSDLASADDIYLMNSDGSRQRRLTHFGDADAPAWSPDAKRIVFAGKRSGSWQIWVISANGGHQRQLTHNHGGFATDPSWQGLR
jgi:Tol biopolymer transport system component